MKIYGDKMNFDQIISNYLEKEGIDLNMLKEAGEPNEVPQSPNEGQETPSPQPEAEENPPVEENPPEQQQGSLPEGLSVSIANVLIKAIKLAINNPNSPELLKLVKSDVPTSDEEAVNLIDQIENLSNSEIPRADPSEFHGPAVKNVNS
jgi:hypothetical protein